MRYNSQQNTPDRINFFPPYDPHLVTKIKTIEGRKWHPAEKQWSFSNTDGTLQKILEVFKGEKIHIDPALQTKLPINVIVSPENIGTKQSQRNYFNKLLLIPPLEKGGKGGFF